MPRARCPSQGGKLDLLRVRFFRLTWPAPSPEHISAAQPDEGIMTRYVTSFLFLAFLTAPIMARAGEADDLQRQIDYLKQTKIGRAHV